MRTLRNGRDTGPIGATWTAGARNRSGAARRLLLLCVAAVVGMLAGTLAPLLAPPGGSPSVAVALACGLGNTPTMLANASPALLYPVTKDTPANAPIGVFPQDYVAGRPVAFVEDLSRVTSAPDIASMKWRWSFGDGSGYSYAPSPAHAYAASGTYEVRAQIYDSVSASWTDLDSAEISVIAAAPSSPPVARISASASAVALGGTVTFDAAGSHSRDGSALQYLWNFNDGSTATGPRVTHTFAIEGSGIVALIVTDGRGARTVSTTTMLVVTELPAAKLTASAASVAPGGAVTFDATHSVAPSDPPGDAIVEYDWRFGDGTPELTKRGPVVSHAFAKPGQYTVTVSAVDQQGAPGVANVTVVVLAPGGAAAGAGRGWLLLGGGAAGLALLVAGWLGLRAQRRRNALIHQRTAALELARARPIRTVGMQGASEHPHTTPTTGAAADDSWTR